MFTNICCIGLCPFLIVFISASLGAIANQIFKSLSASQGTIIDFYNHLDILYCSNITALDNYGWPQSLKFFTPASIDVPGSNGRPTHHSNYYRSLGPDDNFLSILTPKLTACTHWFGHEIAAKTDNASLTRQTSWDTYAFLNQGFFLQNRTFQVPPEPGWLSIFNEKPSYQHDHLIKEFSRIQMREWAIFGGSPEALAQLREVPGWPEATNISIAEQILSMHPSNRSRDDPNLTLLEIIEPRLWTNLTHSNLTGFQIVPFFPQLKTATTPLDMDNELGRLLTKTIDSLSYMNKSILFQIFPDEIALGNFYEDAEDIMQSMPYGGIWFESLNHANRTYKYTLQFGKDPRLQAAPSFPSRGKRTFLQQAQLGNAFLRFSDRENLGRHVIVQGTRIFPQLANSQEYPISENIGKILFPIGLSCLIPIFVVTLVKEKESRTLIMMRMVGIY